jgi:hypothetical protein
VRAPRALLYVPLQLSSGVRRLQLPHSVTQTDHPITRLLEWLPECGFAVLKHGLAPHGRDYHMVIEQSSQHRPGRHRLIFTHVTEVAFTSEVRDDVWRASWADLFTHYGAWEEGGQPEGYVWGVNWSLAYPGIKAVEASAKADQWSRRLQHPMYEAELTTSQFRLALVFHDLRTQQIDDRTDLISQVTIPLK